MSHSHRKRHRAYVRSDRRWPLESYMWLQVGQQLTVRRRAIYNP